MDYVVETKRGHYLGRILNKLAIPIQGSGNDRRLRKERVIHSDRAGVFWAEASIGDWVEAGTPVGYVETSDGQRYPQRTVISGVLRGSTDRDGYRVTEHFKSRMWTSREIGAHVPDLR